MVNNFQRIGAESNSHAGRHFEDLAQSYFLAQGIKLQKDFPVPVGLSVKKPHKFDLGSETPPILVECKSHTWTSGGNAPSAKLTNWNEAMYYFCLAPKNSRKILFVLRDYNPNRKETLAQHYIKRHPHLIPDDVEILEFDAAKSTAVDLMKRNPSH